MERRPAPGVMRYPGPSVVSKLPVTVGFVGEKTDFELWFPYISVAIVLDPPAMYGELVVKNLKSNDRLLTSIIVAGAGNQL